MTIDFQFYPTPLSLAERAFKKFKNRDISRLLEPSVGNGDLLNGDKHRVSNWGGVRYPVDVIEIDASKHAGLKEKGLNVVGHDFESFSNLSIYSHILMNPPFLRGAQHVLRAWNGMFHGEIVAIINAETLRNPFSAERKLLLSIIEMHGDVEYIEAAFVGDDVERETMVEVALVSLVKEASSADIVGNIIGEMREDSTMGVEVNGDIDRGALMMPTSYVENAVLIFNAAVEACKQAHAARAKANYYTSWLGKSMAEFLAGAQEGEKKFDVAGAMRNSFSLEYMELKDRAWTHILNSTEIDEKISLTARKRIHADFEKIKCLEFTVSNIYGFLQGLSESGWEIQKGMICETFDLFTRYSSDNTVFYMGWKSNDRHKKAGMRLKHTRFILPGFSNQGFSYIGFDEIKKLEDIDKSFSIMDGRQKPEFGLAHLFRNRLKELESGERLTSEYFDVRYYPKRGTVHFFVRRTDLVDRLNRLVGQWRQWLPPQDQENETSKDFWKQYNNAEKYADEIHSKFTKSASHRYLRISDIAYSIEPGSDGEKALNFLHDAIQSTLEGHGYNLQTVLGVKTPDLQIEFAEEQSKTNQLALC